MYRIRQGSDFRTNSGPYDQRLCQGDGLQRPGCYHMVDYRPIQYFSCSAPPSSTPGNLITFATRGSLIFCRSFVFFLMFWWGAYHVFLSFDEKTYLLFKMGMYAKAYAGAKDTINSGIQSLLAATREDKFNGICAIIVTLNVFLCFLNYLRVMSRPGYVRSWMRFGRCRGDGCDPCVDGDDPLADVKLGSQRGQGPEDPYDPDFVPEPGFTVPELPEVDVNPDDDKKDDPDDDDAVDDDGLRLDLEDPAAVPAPGQKKDASKPDPKSDGAVAVPPDGEGEDSQGRSDPDKKDPSSLWSANRGSPRLSEHPVFDQDFKGARSTSSKAGNQDHQRNTRASNTVLVKNEGGSRRESRRSGQKEVVRMFSNRPHEYVQRERFKEARDPETRRSRSNPALTKNDPRNPAAGYGMPERRTGLTGKTKAELTHALSSNPGLQTVNMSLPKKPKVRSNPKLKVQNLTLEEPYSPNYRLRDLSTAKLATTKPSKKKSTAQRSKGIRSFGGLDAEADDKGNLLRAHPFDENATPCRGNWYEREQRIMEGRRIQKEVFDSFGQSTTSGFSDIKKPLFRNNTRGMDSARKPKKQVSYSDQYDQTRFT